MEWYMRYRMRDFLRIVYYNFSISHTRDGFSSKMGLLLDIFRVLKPRKQVFFIIFLLFNILIFLLNFRNVSHLFYSSWMEKGSWFGSCGGLCCAIFLLALFLPLLFVLTGLASEGNYIV